MQPYQPPPGVAPPARRAVGRRDLTFHRAGRTLPVRVWYPAAAGSDVVPAAAPAAGRFPLMLFSHGLTNQPDDYAPLLTAWARAGLVVAAPRYPHTAWGADAYDPGDIVHQPADASHVVTALLTGDHPLAGHLDADRVGAGGHSAGGITTAGLLSRVRDVRVKAAMIVAGTDFGGTPFLGPPAAVLFVHGARDRTVTWTAGHTVFAAVPWSRAMLTLTRGGHVLRGAELATVTEFSTDFLRWSLYGDPAARRRLPEAARARGVATLDDQL